MNEKKVQKIIFEFILRFYRFDKTEAMLFHGFFNAYEVFLMFCDFHEHTKN